MSSPTNADEDPLPDRIDRSHLWRLLALARPHRAKLGLCLALAVLATITDLAMPWATKLAIDQAITPAWRTVAAEPKLAASLHDSGALDMPDGGLIVMASALPAALAAELDHRHLWRTDRYRDVGGSLPDGVTPLRIHGRVFVAESALAALTPLDRLRVCHDDVVLLGWVATGLFIVLVIRLVVNMCLGWFLRSTGQRVVTDLRRQVVDHVLRLPAAAYDREPVGRLVTRATNDVAAVEELFSVVIITVVKDVLLLCGGLTLLFVLDWRLAAIVTACMPLVIGVSWAFRRRIRDVLREVRAKVSKINAFLAESLSGWRTVQACAQEGWMRERFNAINNEEFHVGLRQMYLFSLFMPLVAFSGVVCAALVLWFGGGGVHAGWLTLGGLVAFLAYVELAFAPIRDLAEKHSLTQAAVAAGERLFRLLDQPREADGGDNQPARIGTVVFSDVWFRYPARAGESELPWVLQGVSFTIAPGERIALVGATGSGKSTIAGLMLRFHDPERGTITLAGVDLRGCDRRWLRNRVASVTQDVHLYAGTVADNIALFSDNITLEQMAALYRNLCYCRFERLAFP